MRKNLKPVSYPATCTEEIEKSKIVAIAVLHCRLRLSPGPLHPSSSRLLQLRDSEVPNAHVQQQEVDHVAAHADDTEIVEDEEQYVP